VDSARCPACGEDEEDTDHFLLRCPNYTYKRWDLGQAVRKKNKLLTMETLLGDPEMTNLLAKYITSGKLHLSFCIFSCLFASFCTLLQI
jgi:hypothetical protein